MKPTFLDRVRVTTQGIARNVLDQTFAESYTPAAADRRRYAEYVVSAFADDPVFALIASVVGPGPYDDMALGTAIQAIWPTLAAVSGPAVN